MVNHRYDTNKYKKENEKFEKTFIIVMLMLISIFLLLFFKNPYGNQGNVFFIKTDDYMADYYNVSKYVSERNPYYFGIEDPNSAEHAYPPLAYLIFYPLSKTISHSDIGHSTMEVAVSAFFMFVVSGAFFILLYDIYKGKKHFKFLLSLMLVFSGVFIFTYERGNLIILTAALSGFFLLNYKNENKIIRELALIALALATGLKGYPAILGIILIFDKQFKEALRLFLYGLAAIFLPFLFFQGGFSNIPTWLGNLKANSAIYEFGMFPRFNFRYWFVRLNNYASKEILYSFMKLGSLILAGLGVLFSYFHKKEWKKVMQLLLVIMIWPVNSALYVAVYLFIGIMLFFNEKEHDLKDWFYMVLFILILNPIQLFIGTSNLSDFLINFSGTLLLLSLTLESVFISFKFFKGLILKK